MPTASALYRRILKLHRLLPYGPKALGDQYARDEFKRHKNVPVSQAQQFLNEWKIYADTLEQQLKQENEIGKDMSVTDIEKLSEEQIGQLYALQQEALDPNPQKPDNFNKPLK